MDEMKIQSELLKGLIGDLLSSKMKKKLGVPNDIRIQKLSMVNDGQKTRVQLSMDLEVRTIDIPKIFEKMGLF